MKSICLVRHAKAVGKNLGIPDFERSLTEKGIRDARAMARRLAGDGIVPDLLISSPAHRALETAREFAAEYAVPMKDVVRNEGLYYDRAESFFDIVRECDNGSSLVMLFGHNPTFTEFASLLTPDFDDNMPKSASVLVSFDVDAWSKITQHGGELVRFDSPKDKRGSSRRSEEELLTSRVAGAINAVLAEQDAGAAEKTDSDVKKAAAKIVTRFNQARQQ